MDIRKEWLNNITDTTDNTSSQFYSADETINEVIENFNIRRYYSAEGADLSVDDVDCRAIVQYFSNPLNKVRYDRELHVPMDINIRTGSLINYKNKKWLVVSSIDDLQAYKSAGIVETNNTLTFNKNYTLSNIPCIISSQISLNTTLSADSSKYIEALSNEIFVRVPVNEETDLINVNDKFKIGRWNYKVQSISDIIENGLYVIKMCFVADEAILSNYELSILNGDNIEVNESDALVINVQVIDTATNTIVSPIPSIIFSSSNTDIATINSNTGVVTILNSGSVVFTAKLASDLTILDTISVTIVEFAVDNYVVESIVGDAEIVLNYESTLTARILNNGIWDNTKGVVWTVLNQDLSLNNYVTIVSQNSSTLVIKASDNIAWKNKIVTIRATFSENALVYSEKNIKLISLF